MAIDRNLKDNEGTKFVESTKRPNHAAVEVVMGEHTPYGKVQAQLKQLELCNIDIKTLPLLINDRGFVVTLNDGSFIYTEAI